MAVDLNYPMTQLLCSVTRKTSCNGAVRCGLVPLARCQWIERQMQGTWLHNLLLHPRHLANSDQISQ